MNLEQEFKKYVKDFSSKIDYDISNEELNTIYKGFFDSEIGIMNHLISSRIQDMMFEKQQRLNKENDIGKVNEFVC